MIRAARLPPLRPQCLWMRALIYAARQQGHAAGPAAADTLLMLRRCSRARFTLRDTPLSYEEAAPSQRHTCRCCRYACGIFRLATLLLQPGCHASSIALRQRLKKERAYAHALQAWRLLLGLMADYLLCDAIALRAMSAREAAERLMRWLIHAATSQLAWYFAMHAAGIRRQLIASNAQACYCRTARCRHIVAGRMLHCCALPIPGHLRRRPCMRRATVRCHKL